MDRELTPKQQTSEAIRQAEKILILTGQRPSVDQVASTIALAKLLQKFGKKVTAVISDEVPASTRSLPTEVIERELGGLRDFIMRVDLGRAEVDKLKYTIENGKLNVYVTPFSGSFHSRDVSFGYGDYEFDLIIALGVNSYARLDKVYAQNAELLQKIPLVNVDFHRNNEQYGAINLIEGTAASLAEILMALSESLQAGLIDDKIATVMLTGIMAATDRFTATHTTSKTMTVAAQMMAMGADQQKVVKALYARDSRDASRDRKPQQQGGQPQPSAQGQQPARTPEAPAFRPIDQHPPVQQAAPASEPQLPPAPQATPRVEAPQSPVQTVAAPSLQAEPSLPMQELLPPDHIELSDPEPDEPQGPTPQPADDSAELLPPADSVASEPEPLINDTTPANPVATTRNANPTNNPIFAQRLDDFEY